MPNRLNSGHFLVHCEQCGEVLYFIHASFCLMSLDEGSIREDRECWRGQHSREEVCWLQPQTRLSDLATLCYCYHLLFSHSATLANLSPNDQRHITIRTGSSTRARFGKCQTGMPRVYTSTKASVSEPNGLPFKLSLLKFYLFLCLLLNWRKFYIPTKVPPGLLFALIM